MKTMLKTAVIGAGMIAQKAHIPAYQALGDSVSLAAVCDRREESRDACAALAPNARFYTDAEEMLVTEKPDLVSVTTPNLTHAAMVRLALEHGANVLCEKPLTLSSSEATELFALADAKGLRLFACQTMRFSRPYLAAREYVADGLLGTPYYGEINRIRRRGIPGWGRFLSKAENGGGALADIGVHVIDAMLWIIGSPRVLSVSGFAASPLMHTEKDVRYSLRESGALAGADLPVTYDLSHGDVEEFASGVIRTTGAPIHFKIGWAANLPESNAFTILGEKLGMVVPDMRLYSTFHHDLADVKPRMLPLGPWDERPFSGHYYLIQNVVNALLGKEEAIIHPEETINAVAAIELFYRSVQSGREETRDGEGEGRGNDRGLRPL